jgi:quercetin dioxygenase-like cupin family protein
MHDWQAIEAQGRDLGIEELREVADWLGDKPWHDLCLSVGANRGYQELYRGRRLSTWLIHWGESADTGFHDHDLSAGAVRVIRGRVRDDRLGLGGQARTREYGPGESFTIGASDIHRVLQVGDEPALTVHAYSPPLVRMGAYMVEPDGTLTRHSMSWEEELRPLAA